MARRKRFWMNIKHPKITQELKANLKNPYARAKRKKLLRYVIYRNNYICDQKSWKHIGRKHQYREIESNYRWHEFNYSFSDNVERTFAQHIISQMQNLGCFYKYIRNGIKWYGPNIYTKNRCTHCYSKLINDELSTIYGDWCLNDNCDYLK